MPLELTIEERGAPARMQLVAAEHAFVGRREDCEVVLPYSFVSSRHARIQARDGQVLVEDLGSTNGVQVNGEALVPLVPRALSPEDVVQIEKITIRARVVVSPARAAEPTFYEIRMPPPAAAPAAPVASPPPLPSPPPPPLASAPPLPLASPPRPLEPPATVQVSASATAPTDLPSRAPTSALVSAAHDTTAPIPLRAPSLSDRLRETTLAARPRRVHPQGPLTRLAAGIPKSDRFLVLSLVFRGLGLLAVLSGLVLLLLVLLA